jgi:nucleoid DNA-binding protein
MDEKTIIQRIASEYNLPISKVEEIVYHQFKYTAQLIRKGEFESVRLPYLGKFHVRKGRLNYLNERPDNS